MSQTGSMDSREGQLCYAFAFDPGESGDRATIYMHQKNAKKLSHGSSVLSEFFYASDEDELESAPPDLKRRRKQLMKMMKGSQYAVREADVVEVAAKTETKWHDLPMELLVRILALVDMRSVIGASGVCRGWRDSMGMGVHELSFSWCGNKVSKLVQSVAPKFPRLQSCKMRRCAFLDDTAIKAAAESWHELKVLDLTNGTRLTDVCLHSLAHGCPLLEKLDLSGCTGITETGLVVLAQYCKNLRNLNLCGCDSRGMDTALLALAEHCTSLQLLNVGWCEHITDKGVIALTNGCPDLRVIDLCGCSLITDRSVIALSYKCKQLCALGLHCCRNITDDAMYTLAKSGQRDTSEHAMRNALKKAGQRNLDGSLDESLSVARYLSTKTSSTSSSGSTCSDASKLPVMKKEGLDTLLGQKYNRHGLVSLNLSGCISLSAQAVQAVCDAFPELHTCPERPSLIISGCLNLTPVHCICVVEARRERSNRERKAALPRHFPP